jgi:hypothetical protein
MYVCMDVCIAAYFYDFYESRLLSTSTKLYKPVFYHQCHNSWNTSAGNVLQIQTALILQLVIYTSSLH